MYEAIPIGLFRMLDQGVSDEKVLAFAAGDPRFAGIADFAAVQPHLLKEIEHFFSVYKALEGKQTHVQGWGSADEARAMISACHERFLNKNA